MRWLATKWAFKVDFGVLLFFWFLIWVPAPKPYGRSSISRDINLTITGRYFWQTFDLGGTSDLGWWMRVPGVRYPEGGISVSNCHVSPISAIFNALWKQKKVQYESTGSLCLILSPCQTNLQHRTTGLDLAEYLHAPPVFGIRNCVTLAPVAGNFEPPTGRLSE